MTSKGPPVAFDLHFPQDGKTAEGRDPWVLFASWFHITSHTHISVLGGERRSTRGTNDKTAQGEARFVHQ